MIHPDELRRRVGRGESFAIIDARSDATYRESGSTVRGAIRLSPEVIAQRLSEIPRGKTLLLVADDDAAESMALGFLRNGYTDVYLIEGGFAAFEKAGGPMERRPGAGRGPSRLPPGRPCLPARGPGPAGLPASG